MSFPFTVNPLPAPIAGPTVVCDNASIVLTETSPAGFWSSTSNGTVSPVGPSTTTTLTGNYNPVTGSAVDTVTFTSSAGCAVIYQVTVNARPGPLTVTNPVCTGTCDTFTSTPASVGGVWAPTTGGVGTIDATTGVFCAVTVGTGTVTVTYTYPITGCFRQKIITVNPMPAPITGPDSVCLGGSVSLCETLAGGTWSAPLPNGSIVSFVTGTGGCETVNGEAVGVTEIDYCRAGCCATVSFTVNPVVGTITSSKPDMCACDTATLSAIPGGGTWTSDLTAVADIGSSSGIITGACGTGGIVHFTYTAPGGCTATFTMNVNGYATIFGPRQVCTGALFNETATGGSGAGTWSSSRTSVAIIGSATGNGTVIGSGVTANGYDSSQICFTTTVGGCTTCFMLTVNPAPPAISGPTQVCEGFTIALTDAAGPGTWTAINTHAAVGGTTGIVLGQTAGVDTITFYNGGGCTVTHIVTVHPSPAAITGVTDICAGQTTVLNDVTGGGPGNPVGVWTYTATPVGSGSASPVSPTQSHSTTVTGTGGIIVVRYAQGFYGCYVQTTVTVTPGVGGAIVGPNSVCQGSTITLSIPGSGLGVWSSSNTGVATVGAGTTSSTVVTADAPGGPTGTTVITFAGTSGCSATKTVTVNQTPIAIITPIGRTNLCPGDNAVLTATTGTGFTYQWYRGGGPIAGATNATYTTNVPGNYTVIISTGLCQAVSPPQSVTMNPVTAGLSPLTSVVCASTPPTLTATATPGGPGLLYQWIGSSGPIAGATAATYIASVAGTYTVKITNSFGCSGTSPTATVTLVPSPVFSVSPAGPLTLCAGASTTLTATGGATYTYQWNRNGTPVPGATNLMFVASSAGTYTMVESNGTCSTGSPGIVINAIAPPLAVIAPATDTTACFGSNVVLTAPAGPFTYQWYRGGVAIAGATTVTYVASTTGAYTVKVTSIGTGCSATSLPENVNVVPTPVVSPLSATSFCWGGSVRLSATVVAPGIGIAYAWFKNGVAIPGATGPNYTATTTGMYSVKVTLSLPGGAVICGMTSRTVSVTQYPLPNPLITFDGINFHTGAYVTYQWYKNTIAIAGATTSAVHNRGIGSYTVRVTDVNGCQSVSPAYVLTYLPPAPPGGRDISDEGTNVILDAGNIKIFPNPAQNQVHIESPIEVRAVIASMDGRIVVDKAAAKDVDLGGLPDGIYVIKLYNTDGILVRTEKLVKAAN
jgi:hypothetical protein